MEQRDSVANLAIESSDTGLCPDHNHRPNHLVDPLDLDPLDLPIDLDLHLGHRSRQP